MEIPNFLNFLANTSSYSMMQHYYDFGVVFLSSRQTRTSVSSLLGLFNPWYLATMLILSTQINQNILKRGCQRSQASKFRKPRLTQCWFDFCILCCIFPHDNAVWIVKPLCNCDDLMTGYESGILETPSYSQTEMGKHRLWNTWSCKGFILLQKLGDSACRWWRILCIGTFCKVPGLLGIRFYKLVEIAEKKTPERFQRGCEGCICCI